MFIKNCIKYLIKGFLLRHKFDKYKSYTMIPRKTFIANLRLVSLVKNVEGIVVECGVWRGGMIAGIAEILGQEREYYLFDSFEGLPDAKDIDGQAAKDWQMDTSGSFYFNNCKAEMSFAEKAMQIGKVKHYHLIKGWFSDTLPLFSHKKPIALLRLDGDWYESTMDCLINLFPKVAKNGLIIIDDYYMWDGCARAVHDYIAENKLPYRIRSFNSEVCYIQKTENLYYIPSDKEK